MPSASRLVLDPVPDLEVELRQLMQQIPKGQVTTYGRLAAALGDPSASRWVGQFARDHVHAAHCPCHRIVLASGELGGYITGRPLEKQVRLVAEGVVVEGGRVAACPPPFDHFESNFPLAALRKQQSACAAEATLQPLPQKVTRVGGIDVSFSDGKAFATLVCLGEGETPEWHATMVQTVRFPYISGYLAFRELPIASALLHRIAGEYELPPVLLVDGSGMLHPRRCGVATMLGVLASIPTIGITKKLLCGAVDATTLAQRGTASVVWEDQPLGMAARLRGRSQRPIYISPGHQADVVSAFACARSFWGNRRLPAPIYWADRLSRAWARSRPAAAPGALWTGKGGSI